VIDLTFLVLAMPRRARVVVPEVPLHIIHRGHNCQPCFNCSQDFQIYLDWLGEHCRETGCLIHAYVLMTNHVHLLMSVSTSNAAAALMKSQAQRYAQYVNRRYHRSGSVWEGRFRSCLTQQDRYFLACQRYIELNPVRANMVVHPTQYRWSSYRVNALGEAGR
jgi:putative transposase